MEKKEEIKNILESLVNIYRHNSSAVRNSQYSKFLEDISSNGKDSFDKTIDDLYSLGVNYMENGRADDINLFSTLSSLNNVIISRAPKLGERCREKLKYVYSRNWALLETL